MEKNRNQKIATALNTLTPLAQWALIGDNYEDLQWFDTEQVQPTLAKVEAEIANPTPQPEPTVADKLASVGLSIEDLKAALA